MAARSIARGTVTFGLVSIPVRFYSTNEPSSGLSFHLLHEGCSSRLKQQYICPDDGKVIPRSEMVKGYEFAKDQYVVLKPEELQALEAASTQAIEIREFVPSSSIDPILYDTSYYLAPDKGAERAYALLSQALRESELFAVTTYAARGKEHVALIRPFENGLALQQLRWHDEVKPMTEVPVPEVDLRPGELDLALQFIEHLRHASFDPSQYTDRVRERVQALIDRKIEGQEITVQAPSPEQPRVLDLMEALKKSLEQTKSDSKATKPKRRKTTSKA